MKSFLKSTLQEVLKQKNRDTIENKIILTRTN